jgi:hypothetical protein
MWVALGQAAGDAQPSSALSAHEACGGVQYAVAQRHRSRGEVALVRSWRPGAGGDVTVLYGVVTVITLDQSDVPPAFNARTR